LRLDLHRARGRRDQQESARLLVEARRLFDQGNLEEAKACAERSRRLHGPYSLLEGDRAAKLIAEIETAETRRPARRLPPPDAALAPVAVAGTPPADPTRGMAPGQPVVPPLVQARQQLAEAKQLQAAG